MEKIKNGFALVEILVVLAIIAIKVLNNYYNKQSMGRETKKFVSEQGIDITSYSPIVGSVKNTLQNAKNIQVDIIGQ